MQKVRKKIPYACNEKGDLGAGYEVQLFLPPKWLYLDNPVACVDYSSLYPSSMIVKISHDSKVWTKNNGRRIN